mmetsp:Transcript_10319/g.24769  ORF Transcript_10319/g.24769 Transcript_10319/m.24769 type:complete len:393 (-) Transcript_10319:42-1220(-)
MTARVVGHVTRRRCFGKNLAFADILVEEIDRDDREDKDLEVEEDQTIQVVFRSSNVNVPPKNSELPYGAKLSLLLTQATESTSPTTATVSTTTSRQQPQEHTSSSRTDCKQQKKLFDVLSWNILVDPRVDALDCAKQDDGSDGLVYSSYLKSRGLAYLRFNNDLPVDPTTKSRGSDPIQSSMHRPETTVSPTNGAFSHGNNQAKGLRAKIFASFLLETYGPEFLASGNGVLDVAGGKGAVSIQLSLNGFVPCTIIDPLVRKHGEKLTPREAKRIRKMGSPHPALLSREFNRTTFMDDCCDLLDDVSVLVGLHPDQPTEEILDVALQLHKPVAIVPCCVFPCFFPQRTLPCGSSVQSYDQFLEYLLLKDPRLRRCELPFEGRNNVIYLPKNGD